MKCGIIPMEKTKWILRELWKETLAEIIAFFV